MRLLSEIFFREYLVHLTTQHTREGTQAQDGSCQQLNSFAGDMRGKERTRKIYGCVEIFIGAPKEK